MAVSDDEIIDAGYVPIITRLRLDGAPYSLAITYSDGADMVTNMAGIIHKRDALAVLRPLDAFAACHVTFHGAGVEWDAGPDFSADALRQMAESQLDAGQKS